MNDKSIFVVGPWYSPGLTVLPFRQQVPPEPPDGGALGDDEPVFVVEALCT